MLFMTLPLIKCDDRFETGDGFGSGTRFGADTSTEDFICWSLRRFKGWRTTFTTSFGMEGCALIDMYASRGKPMEVVYLDTGFFFDETYELIERMKERYPQIEFVDRGTTMSPREQAEILAW